jgi:hypothetical protein
MLGRTGFVVIAVISAVIGAHSLNPRELYNEMYPVETLKRDAFHICNDADPSFVRAVGADREACYNSMPHLIAVALGRVTPNAALTNAALIDPSRQAELLMLLAGMPPRQPITQPRSFANAEWARALSPGCDDKRPGAPPVAYTLPSGLPPPPGNGRAAALDNVIRGNLPPLPRAAQAGIAKKDSLPVMSLGGRDTALPPAPVIATESDATAAAAPLPNPDLGDKDPQAIIPLAPSRSCNGA